MSAFSKFMKLAGMARLARTLTPGYGGSAMQFPGGAMASQVYAKPGRPMGVQRVWSPGPFPAGTNNVTIQNQIPVPSGVNGFSLVYENGTTTASTLNTSKYAYSSTDGDNGATLPWASNTIAGATSAALPVAVGAAPQSLISQVITDRQDVPSQGALYLDIRSYFSGSGCALNPAAGELAAFASATGLIYKSGFAGGVVADNAGITMSAGQLICPSGVIWYADRPILTIAAFAGSTFRGQGSTANALGMIARTALLLSNANRLCLPYIGAQSGQNSTASNLQLAKTLQSILPDVVFILVGSGNDSDLTDKGFRAMRSRVAANIEQIRKVGAVPVLVTAMPAAGLTVDQNTLRVAQNTWGLSLDGVLKVDASAIASNPANPAQLLPAYDSGDGTHLNDAGHAAVAAVMADMITKCVLLR